MSYGSVDCNLVGKEWVITGDPFVLYKAKSVFNVHPKVATEVRIPATPELTHELQWFRIRYPMQIRPELKMRSLAAQHAMTLAAASKITSSDYKPEVIEFASGLRPRLHQSVAADLFKATGGLLLADGLGLGKTISAITAFSDPALRPVVVVVPTHLATQWKAEIERFVPSMSVHIVQTRTPYKPDLITKCQSYGAWVDTIVQTKRGTCTCKRCKASVTRFGVKTVPDVTIVTYAKLSYWTAVLASYCKTVIYDEAHALRRSGNDRYPSAVALSRAVRYRMGMTGTPIFNMGGEIWNVMECIQPNCLGTKDQFRSAWCMSSYESNGKEPMVRDPEALGSYLKRQNLMLRRGLIDIGHKPMESIKIVQKIDADPNVFDKMKGRASELARILLNESPLKRGEAMQAGGEFENLMRQATGLAKAPFIASFVEMLLEQGLPVVLFGWHHSVYQVYMERLASWRPVLYTGKESVTQKEASLNKFMKGDSQVFICSLRSGEGLNGLQYVSSTTVTGELDWANAVHEQNMGRVAREGQKNPCQHFFPISDFGFDPIMSEVLALKQGQSDGLMGNAALGPVKKVDSTKVLRELAQKYLQSV